MLNSKSEAATKLILFLFWLSTLWAHSKNWKIHYYVSLNKRARPVSSRTQDPKSASQMTCSAQKFEGEARTQTVGISLEFFPMEMLVASSGGSLSNGPGSSCDGIQVKLGHTPRALGPPRWHSPPASAGGGSDPWVGKMPWRRKWQPAPKTSSFLGSSPFSSLIPHRPYELPDNLPLNALSK